MPSMLLAQGGIFVFRHVARCSKRHIREFWHEWYGMFDFIRNFASFYIQSGKICMPSMM